MQCVKCTVVLADQPITCSGYFFFYFNKHQHLIPCQETGILLPLPVPHSLLCRESPVQGYLEIQVPLTTRERGLFQETTPMSPDSSTWKERWCIHVRRFRNQSNQPQWQRVCGILHNTGAGFSLSNELCFPSRCSQPAGTSGLQATRVPMSRLQHALH